MTNIEVLNRCDLTVSELTQRKNRDRERLYHHFLGDPDFVRYKCDPQSLSFMSDISARLRKLYPNIEPNVKKVLDVGARTATGSNFLQTVHHPHSFSAVKMNVTAIDIDSMYKKYAEAFFPDIEYVVGDIFTLPDKSYDIVICSHTIEHVQAPGLFIEKMCKIAKEYVIVACPYEEPIGNLAVGHIHSINKKFIEQFDYEFLEIYTSMHWHQSKACVFAIKTNRKTSNSLNLGKRMKRDGRLSSNIRKWFLGKRGVSTKSKKC